MQFVVYIKLRLALEEEVLMQSGLLAELLTEHGAEGVEELEGGVEVYFSEDRYRREEHSIAELISSFPSVRIVGVDRIEPQNWNALWESTVTPVLVHAAGRTVEVHASFHSPNPEADIHIVVDPKMAFGTGHHATTAMMLAYVLEQAKLASSCLDMGCGSGVLAILAAHLGVPSVLAIDNDPWACSNAKENAQTNVAGGVEVRMGDFGSIPSLSFDLVLANLTRNLLLDHMDLLSQRLSPEGVMAISGFYSTEVPMLAEQARLHGLAVVAEKEQDSWAALLLRHRGKEL